MHSLKKTTEIRSPWSLDEYLLPPPCGSPLETQKSDFPWRKSSGWFTTDNASNRAEKKSGLCYLKDITGKRYAIIIPNGVSKGDAGNADINKAYRACLDYRCLDNLLLHALLLKNGFRPTLYEATLAEANTYPTAPTDLIGDITFTIAQAAPPSFPSLHSGIFQNL